MKTITEIAEELGYSSVYLVTNPQGKALEFLSRFADRIREECARICEDHFASDGEWCAKQIRAAKNNATDKS